MIVFRNVVKIFNRKTRALDNASFTIPKGVLAGLLGPNGAGKTTSFKLILGLIKRNSGEIKVFGFDPWEKELEVRIRSGYLPEKPVYPGGVRVWKFLEHIARLRGVSRRDVVRIAKTTGIYNLLDKPIKTLSRGYLQRLGIAQALIGDPELLLLDEPTANLDPLARVEILNLIKVLQKDLGATVIIATHILPELEPIVNYVVFIKKGRIVEYGYLEDISKKYFIEITYSVETDNPRKLALLLMDLDYIKGIEVKENAVYVKIDTKHSNELAEILLKLQEKGLVKSFTHSAASLGDLYAKLASKI